MSILIQDLSVSFNKNLVLDNINLEIKYGQCYCLLGKNGAGKTTFLNCILDLIAPDKGIVSLKNLNYTKNSLEIKKSLGAVCEANPLVDEFTGRHYLEFVGKLHNIPSEILKERINSVTSFFFADLNDLKKFISTYSTGMKRKLAVCAAILHKPDILLLDEPFAGLDPLAAKQLIQFLNKFLSNNKIILLSSHDLAYVEQVATHIGVLNEGQIVFSDTLNRFTSDGKDQIGNRLFEILKPHTEDIRALEWIAE